MSRRTGPTRKARDLAMGRDGMHCVLCGSSTYLQLHHRRARAMGGTRRPESNEPANLITVCLECHAWIESNRETALDRGLLVPQHRDPADVPLVWHGSWTYLDNDGGVRHCRTPDDPCTDEVPCPSCPHYGASA